LLLLLLQLLFLSAVMPLPNFWLQPMSLISLID
jgi:hypothetical protein